MFKKVQLDFDSLAQFFCQDAADKKDDKKDAKGGKVGKNCLSRHYDLIFGKTLYSGVDTQEY
jgi:hypothetical protein